MSFTENDRKFRSNSGKSFPDGDSYDGQRIVGALAEALRADFGSTPSSMKQIARLTRANERTIRNWMDARNGPRGENLIVLMQHSDAVFEIVLTLAHRVHAPGGMFLIRLREQLMDAVSTIDALEAGQA
ncbi:hypothetical protein [Phenylobacterium sp.]|uniref:hypothetical protein n=1 Tax=Phenylobacterium sp. TaxID=1871053 RepID=UPI0025E90A70|nr:hypothetical protein [Phenylobacterium sp.]MBX3483103.1 hypothetical protein [Phenylobacterium sp.]MCW5758449.1 hypothetical protein [Phenylobacterium sp.]